MKKPEHLSIHNDFRITGESLQTPDSILTYVQERHPEHHEFLRDYFDDKDYITLRTSGSTGSPKNWKVLKSDLKKSAQISAKYFSLPPGTKALHCLSSTFIAGKMMWVRALVNGWNIHPVPVDSKPLSHTAEEFDFCAMVPLQVENSLEELDRIATLIIGGAPLSHTLRKRLSGFRTNIFLTYGMTETLSHVAVQQISPYKTYFTALPEFHFDIDDRGCLVIHTPYLESEIITNDRVDFIDKTRFIWLGRYDFVINSGGIKLFPEVIERKLEPYLPVNFFIHGFSDRKYGAIPVLLIEGNRKISKQELEQIYAKAGLDKYEYPKNVFYLKSFIRTNNGKIKRIDTFSIIDKFS